MSLKLDIWRMLGQQMGIPVRGTPDYDAKVQAYRNALSEGPPDLGREHVHIVSRGHSCHRCGGFCPPDGPNGERPGPRPENDDGEYDTETMFENRAIADRESGRQSNSKRDPQRQLWKQIEQDDDDDDDYDHEPVKQVAPPKPGPRNVRYFESTDSESEPESKRIVVKKSTTSNKAKQSTKAKAKVKPSPVVAAKKRVATSTKKQTRE